MVETSTSGSGEGPGEVTTRGYSTAPFFETHGVRRGPSDGMDSSGDSRGIDVPESVVVGKQPQRRSP